MTTQSDMLQFLCSKIATVMGRGGKIDPDVEMCALGLDAISTCMLSGLLSKTFDLECMPCIFFEASTPRDVIDRLCCENNSQDGHRHENDDDNEGSETQSDVFPSSVESPTEHSKDTKEKIKHFEAQRTVLSEAVGSHESSSKDHGKLIQSKHGNLLQKRSD
eukprot:CAMPEP_0196748768 /NCGR_PEP_ID=MMETSP1091-20130531/74479_1 /TAXON_ID=302021 /ORGANISM="Rhodomonas sp., Strain CCMP768" /LENGTH=161 /DNA_ID=CAMNT_0042096127 /DNA_START=26 /DNA_END=508 /DNA_ORIENTATION=-